MVFPEGIRGMNKLFSERYKLQRFGQGFLRLALETDTPIVPVGLVGSVEQQPGLANLRPLAQMLGMPALPITPTFPLLGPLGLLPYPVRYRILYGAPLRPADRFGPEAADDAQLVRYLAAQVRATIQHMLDRNRR